MNASTPLSRQPETAASSTQPTFAVIDEKALADAVESAKSALPILDGPIHIVQIADGYTDPDRYSAFDLLAGSSVLSDHDKEWKRVVGTVSKAGEFTRAEVEA